MALKYFYLTGNDQSSGFGPTTDCPNIEIRARWSTCNPTNGNYYWTNIHAALNALPSGGVAGLIMTPGQFTPSWVMSHVPAAKKVTDTNGVVYPAPWGGILQSYWETFVSAIFSEFGDSTFDHIVMPLVCAKNANTSLDGLPGVGLFEWQAAGYTTTAVTNALNTGASYFQSVFTNTTLGLAWGPVNAGLNFDSTNGAATITTMESNFEALSNILDMNDGVSATWYRPFPSGIKVIYQEVAPQNPNLTNFTALVANAVSGGAAQLQLYPGDVAYV